MIKYVICINNFKKFKISQTLSLEYIFYFHILLWVLDLFDLTLNVTHSTKVGYCRLNIIFPKSSIIVRFNKFLQLLSYPSIFYFYFTNTKVNIFQ